jgi:hypothetical protein
MKPPRLSSLVAVGLALLSGRRAAACAVEGPDAYVGRYVAEGWSPEGYVDVRAREGGLTWGPALWRPARRLVNAGPDAFQIEELADRRVLFVRDARGCVTGMTTERLPFEGMLRRRGGGPKPPLAVLLGGEAARAFPGLLKEAGGEPAKLLALGRRMLDVPSQRQNARHLADELTRAYPRSGEAWALRGRAELETGRRSAGVGSFGRALSSEPGNAEARSALEVLRPSGPSPSERALPFTLDEMLRDPSPAEIARVRAAWKDADLAPRDVVVERTGDVVLAGVPFAARVVSHGVPGGRESGVILVPKGARPASLAVLVEAKGVSPDFFPLTVPDGLNAPELLGAEVGKFVLVVPGFRGEEVRFAGESFRSTAPHESWSGAVEDLLALLNVALTTTPEADPSRVGVFGRSRGASVALLAAARDLRFRCAAAWAGPADWFRSMAPEGLTPREAAASALRRDAKLDEEGGQDLYNFLRFARAGTEGLAAVRARLIASSPLYFVESLPPAQLHYGAEDSMVPIRNARAIERRLAVFPEAGRRVAVLTHADAGHDQDLFDAPRETRAFLLGQLAARPRPAAD